MCVFLLLKNISTSIDNNILLSKFDTNKNYYWLMVQCTKQMAIDQFDTCTILVQINYCYIELLQLLKNLKLRYNQ